MDEYQHALFFEAKDLTDRDREKIRRHFLKKRDSGGGECGMIEKAGGNIYKICFKEIEDQERVLQRKFHTISLPCGDLCLTVSRTSSPDQSLTQTFAKTNAKGLEKIFKMEIYLLHYLRDNAKANKILQKQLSSIGCTLEFNFDEEEAVVRGDIEKGPGGAFGGAEKWEIQVDRVFINLTERYCCYHVIDPKQKKLLQQDLSFVTDDIQVHSEIGYFVIVGEAEAVKERIEILEKNTPTRKEVPITVKKFKLVEEEFNQEMRAHHPEVKILISKNMIIMEGRDNEVQSGATKLDELMKNVKEKRVKLLTNLLTFISSSGAISKYEARFQQSLKNPVSLEVGSDLVLSSLSSGALDEAWAAVQRDLGVNNVTLEGAAAVPPDLERVKEILTKAKNEANSQELRVNFSFITETSGTSKTNVQIVGYSKNVNKLKEVLHDYQMNQAEIKEVLALPHPELVDCFDQILSIVGMKQTKVTLKASHYPYPCVYLSGPCCHVKEVYKTLLSTLATLTLDTLVLDGPGAQYYFQAAGQVGKHLLETSCQVVIRNQQDVNSSDVRTNAQSVSSSRHSFTPGPSIARLHHNPSGSINNTSLMIKVCNLEDEQVNVLVVPMLKKKLTSTNIGKCLLRKAGNLIQSNFDSVAATCTICPGEVLQVAAPRSLGCSKLFCIECLPWDGAGEQSVQALNNGLKKCLDLCIQQGLTSVAFPVIGPGIVLKYPLRDAIEVLTKSIRQFGSSLSSGSLNTIHVVIKPDYPDSEECYHEVYTQLRLNMHQGDKVIFSSLTSDLDDITITVGGGTKLQLVLGDITNETTDVIVNTTDFVHFQDDGVCKDILTVAGPGVQAQLKNAKVKRGEVFTTPPGSFPCKAIFHVCGEKDAGVTEKLVSDIIQFCDISGYKSVAIPAISAGHAGLDPGIVAGAIIRGVETAMSSSPLHCPKNIRLVLIRLNVFLEFKKEVMQKYSNAVINRVSVPQMPHAQQEELPRSLNADLSILQTSFTNQKSAFLFVGVDRNDVNTAMTKLKDLYQAQCSTQTFTKEQLESLTQDDIQDLKKLVETEGLHMQMDQSGQGSLVVSGLKDGVNQVMQMINVSLHGSLRREVRGREEEDLYTRVAWCILGANGNWERLPKTANRNLENNDAAGGIVDKKNIHWTVDLQRMEATRHGTTQTAKLKRLQNLPDFTLPLYWDNMASGENIKVVALHPSCAEYRTVKEAFKRTVPKTVIKIERLQNIHLRRGYEVWKKHISDKNRQKGTGEKLLYHGTTQDNCDSIMKSGFNRSFAGQNATAYGHGTYFAVNASYSANPIYSKPAADGSQLMFVTRVLTGVYTLGQSGLKVPPPINNQQPHDLYDSVVDNKDNPNMYVVFHDNQAYPDYLITFK